MNKIPIYLLSHDLKFKVFKELQRKLVKDSGPTPSQGNKVLWRMMRDKQIFCWFDSLVKGDIMLGTGLPTGRKIETITNSLNNIHRLTS